MSTTTYNFTTSAEHGTVYNGSFNGGVFHSGHNTPSTTPSSDSGSLPEGHRPVGHSIQHPNGHASTFSFDHTPSTSAPTGRHHGPAPAETIAQGRHDFHTEPYYPDVAVNRSGFTAMHDPYGLVYPQDHTTHRPQNEVHPACRRSATDPGFVFPKARTAHYTSQPPARQEQGDHTYRRPEVVPGAHFPKPRAPHCTSRPLIDSDLERRSYRKTRGQPVSNSQAQFHMQPHAQPHYTPPAQQYHAPPMPQPRHAVSMPVVQSYGPGYWLEAGPPAPSHPEPPYFSAPNTLLSPAQSIESSEQSSGPSTPRVFMPCPSFPGKRPGWVAEAHDGPQPIYFPEAPRY